MRRTNKPTFFSTTCPHSRTVQCEQDGTEICTDCALVLCDVQYKHDFTPLVSTKNEEEEFVIDLCENLHVSRAFAEDSYSIFKTVKQNIDDQGIETFKWKELRAFSLYEALNRNNAGRSPHEISFYSGIDSTKLWNIERALSINVTRLAPHFLVPRICSALDLSYIDEKNISKICEHMYGFSHFRPENVVGAVIKLYCKEKNIKRSTSSICMYSGATIFSLMQNKDSFY